MKLDYENLFKRLLIMNQGGVYLKGADGHIWIEQDEEVDYPFAAQFKTIMFNTKIYGGIIEAIDTFDVALQRQGLGSLMDAWNEYGEGVLFFGKGGVAESRIDIVPEGKGGFN